MAGLPVGECGTGRASWTGTGRLGEHESKIEGPYRHGTMWRCRVQGRVRAAVVSSRRNPGRPTGRGGRGIDGTRRDRRGRWSTGRRARQRGDQSTPSPMRIEGPFAHGPGTDVEVLTAAGPRWCPHDPAGPAYRMAGSRSSRSPCGTGSFREGRGQGVPRAPDRKGNPDRPGHKHGAGSPPVLPSVSGIPAP